MVPAQSNEHDCRHDYHNDFINFGGWTEMLYCTGQAAPTWSCSRARRNGTPCTTQQQLHPTTATTVHVFISRHAQPTAGRCRLLHLRVLRSNARNRGRVYAKFREAACFPSRDLIVQRPISRSSPLLHESRPDFKTPSLASVRAANSNFPLVTSKSCYEPNNARALPLQPAPFSHRGVYLHSRRMSYPR